MLGLAFLFDTTLNTSPKLRLQKVLPCRHPCHTWDLGLGTHVGTISPNFHALYSWDAWIDPKEGLAVLDEICNIYIPATWIRSAHEIGPPLAPSSVLFFRSSKKLMAFSSPLFSGLVSSALHLTKVRPRCRMLIIPARYSELAHFFGVKVAPPSQNL